MKKSKIWSIGFMLFAMFFGAGNLIFPPSLGYAAGKYFWFAIIGFTFTGVGLPLISIIVSSMTEGGFSKALSRISPAFSIVLMVLINLSIGPFFAIPRTAATAFDMGILPFIQNDNSKLALLVFSAIFFIISLLISLRPSDLSNTIGKFLTPIMLVTICILIVKMLFMYVGSPANPTQASFNAETPLLEGFVEGYLTMDAIGAVTFSAIVMNLIKSNSDDYDISLFKSTLKAALISAVLLGAIYIALGWGGAYVQLDSNLPQGQHIGTSILQYIASKAFGGFGIPILSIIVGLACLTTSIGLISSVSEYFHSLIPKVSYKIWAILFTLLSFIFANQGLEQVIETSKPILGVIYPIVMTSVLLILVSKLIPSPKISLQIPIFTVTALSVATLLHKYDILDLSTLESLPLYKASLEWLLFAVLGYLIGFIIGIKKPHIRFGGLKTKSEMVNKVNDL